MRSEIKSENLILRKYEIGFAPLLFEAAIESGGGEFFHLFVADDVNIVARVQDHSIKRIGVEREGTQQNALSRKNINLFFGGIVS